MVLSLAFMLNRKLKPKTNTTPLPFVYNLYCVVSLDASILFRLEMHAQMIAPTD